MPPRKAVLKSPRKKSRWAASRTKPPRISRLLVTERGLTGSRDLWITAPSRDIGFQNPRKAAGQLSALGVWDPRGPCLRKASIPRSPRSPELQPGDSETDILVSFNTKKLTQEPRDRIMFQKCCIRETNVFFIAIWFRPIPTFLIIMNIFCHLKILHWSALVDNHVSAQKK